jgi:penicillin-binding protein 1C
MKRRYRYWLLAAAVAAAATWLAVPPRNVIPDHYSTLVLDTQGKLLRATLAKDGQYRFPIESQGLPDKYVTALVASEDKRFFSHPGVDLLALAGAALTNIKKGERIRGGSTITMQVARLAEPKKRTYFAKLAESATALKLSLHYSKKEILGLYAAHVPMGGNIVGVETASRVYYGKPAEELTWAEAALFAVLPNAPSMVNVERRRPALIERRNALLSKLFEKGVIDDVTYEASREEPLPVPTRDLPFEAPHFAQYAANAFPHERVCRTTLDEDVQRRAEEAARVHHDILARDGIQNLAVLVVETRTGKVRAWVGSHDFYDSRHGGQVDGVRAERSTGSLLKPFLAAKALDRGPYTMQSKIQDVPTFFGTFTPQNASKEFSGLVSLEDVLVQSLNVPSVRLLNAYGVRDFYDFLQDAGLHGLFRSPDGYGLALILGGAEANLHELVQLYAALGNGGRSTPLVVLEPSARQDAPQALVNGKRPHEISKIGGVGGASETPAVPAAHRPELFSKGAAWLVLNTLTRLSRPGSEYYWEYFDNRVPVAWKTGTSYGQKDAWAIGVNRQWTIGVWAGNFTGEGNAMLTGHASAAPLLFSLFNQLTRPGESAWFDDPLFDLAQVECCAESGFPAGSDCPHKIMLKRPKTSRSSGTCPYHKKFLVDEATGREVCSLCWSGLETEWITRYVVPPAVKEIFTATGRRADDVPIHTASCPEYRDTDRIELVYPVDGVKIFVPRDFDGVHEKIVFTAKHQRPATHLFWYLNGDLVGETAGTHECPVDLAPGDYTLTVQDENGLSRSARFSAFRKKG